MKCEIPGKLFLLVLLSNHSVELDSNGDAPFQRFMVWAFEPHIIISIELISWSKLVESLLDLSEQIEEVVHSWRHYIEAARLLHMIDIIQVQGDFHWNLSVPKLLP